MSAAPRLLILAITLAMLGVPTAAQSRTDFQRSASAMEARCARELRQLTEHAVARKDVEVARKALALAESWGADPSWRARWVAKLEEINEPAEGAAAERWTKTLESVRKKLSGVLAKRRATPEDETAWQELLWRLLGLEPGPDETLATLATLASTVAAKDDPAESDRFLERAADFDPEGRSAGRYVAVEAVIGKRSRLRIKAAGHAMEAFVLLPPGWNAEARHPLAVYIDGAGSRFEQAAQVLRREVGDRDYVIVVPFTLSNANELDPVCYPYDAELISSMKSMQQRGRRIAFDAEGLKEILALVRERFRTEDRFSMTGYSGGGFLTYYWLHHHPDQLVAAAPASANYWSEVARDGVKHAPEGPPRVHLFTGKDDQVGAVRIFPQNDEAAKALETLGFPVKRSHLEGRGHEPFMKLVFDFFDEVRGRKGRPGP